MNIEDRLKTINTLTFVFSLLPALFWLYVFVPSALPLMNGELNNNGLPFEIFAIFSLIALIPSLYMVTASSLALFLPRKFSKTPILPSFTIVASLIALNYVVTAFAVWHLVTISKSRSRQNNTINNETINQD